MRAVGYIGSIFVFCKAVFHEILATRLRCSGLFNDKFIANSPLNVAVEKFTKSVNNSAACEFPHIFAPPGIRRVYECI